MSDTPRPQDDDATRGLTLRELVLEVRGDTKNLRKDFEKHMVSHAIEDAIHSGELRVFGFARSGIAIFLSILSAAVAAATALHIV